MYNGLKPCPFCGSEDVTLNTQEGWDGLVLFYVRCGNCCASSAFCADSERATAAWNKRIEAEQAYENGYNTGFDEGYKEAEKDLSVMDEENNNE